MGQDFGARGQKRGSFAPLRMTGGGGGLPRRVRHSKGWYESLAPRIALLYGLNTVGAGMGALTGGWLILGSLGFEASLRVAALLEVLAAALALTLGPAMRRRPDPAAAPLSSARRQPQPVA